MGRRCSTCGSPPAPDTLAAIKNIETLIDEGGDISIGRFTPFDCVASAADGNTCLAMLVRRDGETLGALIKRLHKAIGLAWSEDLFTDEVNGP